MNKIHPHYELKLTYPKEDGTIEQKTITDPISIRFSVTKNTFQSSNTTHITVYNMDIDTRENIYQDNLLYNQEKSKTATLSAGYGDEITVISFGYIQQCYTKRQGTDIVTEIEVIDPDILTNYTAKTFRAGTEKKEAYLNILRESLPTLSVGVGANSVDGVFEIDTVFDGNAFQAINLLTGQHTFIDDAVLHTLYDNETIGNYGVYYIAAETGMLETPTRQDALLQVKMLFEPKIRLGQLVEIKSETAYNKGKFDGQFKVIGISHECSISNSEGGTRITTVSLKYIDFIQSANVSYTGSTADPQAVKIEGDKKIPIFATVAESDKYISNYIKTHNGQLPPNNIMLSKKISLKEMIYPSGSNNNPAHVAQQITPEIIANCRTIASRLSDFCIVNFQGKTIKIESGFRTRQNNSSLEGSSATSYHLSGNAIDFKIVGVTHSQMVKKFENWQFGLLTNYKTILHVSNDRNERNRKRK